KPAPAREGATDRASPPTNIPPGAGLDKGGARGQDPAAVWPGGRELVRTTQVTGPITLVLEKFAATGAEYVAAKSAQARGAWGIPGPACPARPALPSGACGGLP